MTEALMTLDYERLASNELDCARNCQTVECRKRHLDRAAIYAHRAEKADPGLTRSDAVLALIGTLSSALDEADELGLMTAAIHIDQAIIQLGGIGTLPPEGDTTTERL